GENDGSGQPLAKAGVLEKEEGLVLAVVNLRHQDGAADGAAEFVAAKWRDAGGEEIARVELVVADEFKCGAVKIICPAFGDQADDGAGAFAVLGGIVVLQHAKLRHGIQVKVPELAAAQLVVAGIHAVQVAGAGNAAIPVAGGVDLEGEGTVVLGDLA